MSYQFHSNQEAPPIKYIVVCGASASAIGKGITVSSIAALMQAAGYIVTMTKIDPYLVCTFILAMLNLLEH